MAIRCLREITTTATGSSTGLPFALKCYALWLRYIMGYTNWSQSVSSGDFWSTEKGGSNGSVNLTGSDKTFEDLTAASFVSGDTGKWLVLVDPNNVKNAGIYKVTYVSATQVTLDFRSGGTEYPTQVLTANLAWYLLADNYQVPVTNNDYFRIRTPHAQGWELELLYEGTALQRIRARVSPDATWSTCIIGSCYFGSVNSKTNWFYAFGDSDGSSLHFMTHQATDNRHNGVLVSNVTMYDSGKDTTEKVAVFGATQNNYDGGTCTRATNMAKWGYGHVWDASLVAAVDCYMVELTYGGYLAGLTYWASREKNARRSSGGDDREDLMTGTIIVVDQDNAVGNYQLYGRLQGHYSVRDAITDRTAFNDASASPGKDKFKWKGGMAFEWPSITPQH